MISVLAVIGIIGGLLCAVADLLLDLNINCDRNFAVTFVVCYLESVCNSDYRAIV